jgi:superfamily I DNA and RNA helicase
LFKRHAVNLNLSINCRNTGVILAQTKWATNADVGVTGTGQGPAVSWCQANDASAEAAALAEHLENLLGNEGLGLSDITILDMGDGINTINRLPDSWKSKISPLTNSVVLNWPNRPITLARIANFKGLENTAVCIVGARDISSLTAPINYLYVAMTRALSHLWIGTSVELGRLVEQGLGTDAEVNRARWSN